jgi:hypothetical protein
MKKSLLALAVLGAFAGVASAQSSVTLYGTVDLNARYVKADGQDRRLTLSQDGINSSQLGFRGVEDLGGGLKAGFNLLAGVNADTGTTNSKFFNRRSTVSLFSNLGEVRLGRDYTPTFWNLTIFDAFGTNGRQLAQRPQGYGGTRQTTRSATSCREPGRLLWPGMAGASKAAPLGPAAATTRRPRRLRRGSVRVAGVFGSRSSAPPRSDSRGRARRLVPGRQPEDLERRRLVDFGFMKLMGYTTREAPRLQGDSLRSAA